MKPFAFLILSFAATMSSRSHADGTNDAPPACDAEMRIRLNEPSKQITTNSAVTVSIQIKNVSTNETLLFQAASLSTDFTWMITSPSGKDVPPKQLERSGVAISSWLPRLKPQEAREADYTLNSICDFSEVGTYTLVVKKQVALVESWPSKRHACEIISNPLKIVVTR